ncbi:hypothetical protein JWJ88_11980 (plasmid) [Paracoccus methylovorus]|uniref:Lipoprotein with Yx(FWY)xxD motif n=2 Tax=Paracoccus methylovorus TaxID=2812658 RepID=A0ABX7JL02_9RHOB|nr:MULTISPECIES: hypothetical protein [Paracoccus]QRZ14601.1 hypothetical protein JWJ88_11980 [Paracoccus methylovorus]
MNMVSICLAAGLALLPLGAAQAQTPVAGDGGMALYTFDQDADGKSACYDDCAKNWPPYLGNSGEDKGEGWTLVERTDGTQQWAYDGKPTYYYVGDKAAGEVTGDGRGGVWHVLNE